MELIVYAPVGFFNFMKSMLPGWIEGGRQEVTKQMATAKASTEFAVASGQAGRREAGGAGRRGASRTSRRRSGTSRIPGAAAGAEGGGNARPRAGGRTPPESNGPRPSAERPRHPGYDSLSASQVVERLGGLSQAELEAVRAYEQAARGRRTILNKIGQLRPRLEPDSRWRGRGRRRRRTCPGWPS